MTLRVILLLTLTGCATKNTLSPGDTSVSRTAAHASEIQQLIKRDATNKHWARIYLREIDTGVRNDDWDTIKFYLSEYQKIPMDMVPHHLRNEPGYIQPVSKLEKFFRITVHLPAE